eukprot:2128150-Rhodomonas_salina.1
MPSGSKLVKEWDSTLHDQIQSNRAPCTHSAAGSMHLMSAFTSEVVCVLGAVREPLDHGQTLDLHARGGDLQNRNTIVGHQPGLV